MHDSRSSPGSVYGKLRHRASKGAERGTSASRTGLRLRKSGPLAPPSDGEAAVEADVSSGSATRAGRKFATGWAASGVGGICERHSCTPLAHQVQAPRQQASGQVPYRPPHPSPRGRPASDPQPWRRSPDLARSRGLNGWRLLVMHNDGARVHYAVKSWRLAR
jgi:hypothetical protein